MVRIENDGNVTGADHPTLMVQLEPIQKILFDTPLCTFGGVSRLGMAV